MFAPRSIAGSCGSERFQDALKQLAACDTGLAFSRFQKKFRGFADKSRPERSGFGAQHLGQGGGCFTAKRLGSWRSGFGLELLE